MSRPGCRFSMMQVLGFGWNDPRGWRVYFGTSASDVELKMRVYESMVNSLTQRGIRPVIDQCDVSDCAILQDE